MEGSNNMAAKKRKKRAKKSISAKKKLVRKGLRQGKSFAEGSTTTWFPHDVNNEMWRTRNRIAGAERLHRQEAAGGFFNPAVLRNSADSTPLARYQHRAVARDPSFAQATAFDGQHKHSLKCVDRSGKITVNCPHYGRE